MAKSILIRWSVFSLAVITLGGSVHQVAAGTDANPIAAQLATFSHPNGSTYFALSLKPDEAPPLAGPREVTILFNTSASQTGEYRTRAIDALKATLSALATNDRVQLMAIDLNAIPLTKGFIPAGSKEMVDALAALDARIPLGATDLEKALTAVTASYAGDAKSGRAVLYIGDGRSMANLLGSAAFAKLVDTLVSARIPVSSYILGDRVDVRLPGALAMNTGGNMLVNQESAPVADLGRKLAAIADAIVLWPTAVKFPAEVSEVFPKHTPPLRSDRDTVLIGALKCKGPLQVEMSVEGPKGPEKLLWAAVARPSDDSNNYLTRLVEHARIDGGLNLPLVSSAYLDYARQEMNTVTQNVRRLAQQALSSGNKDAAEKIVDEALRADPNDPEAQALKRGMVRHANDAINAAPAAPAAATVAVQAPQSPTAIPPLPAAVGNAAAAGAGSDLNLVGPAPAAPQPAPEGALLEGVLHDKRVMTQLIQAEVQNALSKARGQMSGNPEAASEGLKLTLEKVRKAPELDPGVREQFADQLEVALREAARRKLEVEQIRQQQLESSASARERMLLTENLLRDQEKLNQLMKRFDSLMDEHRYRLAEDAAAAAAQKLVAENRVSPTAVPEQAVRLAQSVGYYEFMMDIRAQRIKGVIDTLTTVEQSFVPFPDEPPVVYPDAEVWRELSVRRKAKWSTVDLAKKKPAEKLIEKELNKTSQLDVTEMPLSDVMSQLSDLHGITIRINKKALDDAGIQPDAPVTFTEKGTTLKSLLRQVLSDLSLTYLIKNEVLLITTPEDAESQDNMWPPRVYPVADLVVPIQPMGGGMGGGMMGGMGGGMMGGMGGGMMGGGMGGGMMGGGMGGGMMGGMGGGMMGGMGGGMFNLGKDLLSKVPPGGFQAFAVKDDLSVPPAKAAVETPAETPAQATVKGPATLKTTEDEKTSATVDDRPATIDIKIPAGANAESVWNQYFAAHEPQPAAVRAAVRKLMSARKFDHVIALLGGALRHRQAQPWMYEALTLALQAAGRPKAEIERAIMSAVDFVDSTTDLMYIAAYLSQLGLNERALQIYRQVSQCEPLRPEPYTLGLKAARAVDDLEALKWVSLGILGQAWPKQQSDIWQAGVGVAEEVLQRLRATNRTKEAEEFKAARDQALQRDCVAIVTYAGDAEIDLLVGEPSGSFCSLRNPRTTAGGMMLGDALAQTGRDSLGGRAEVYVCPKGFDGTYRLVIRRVWGSVTGGKVNVEVVTHFGAANTIDVQKNIPLDSDEAMVVFDLKDGRRQEALRDQQVANAVGQQLSVNRQILAQQFDASLDSSVQQQLAQSRYAAGGNGGGNEAGNAVNPFFAPPGAVGYQPQIVPLTAGTGFVARAVISADRRYVRISPMPMFSSVSSVYTYNTSTGATGASPGATTGGSTGSTVGSQAGGSGSGAGVF